MRNHPQIIKERLLAEVLAERSRQDIIWGEQNYNDYYWLAILGEEFGEVCRALIEKSVVVFPVVEDMNGMELHSIRNNPFKEHLKKEIIQVAAVCIAWLECIERRKK